MFYDLLNAFENVFTMINQSFISSHAYAQFSPYKQTIIKVFLYTTPHHQDLTQTERQELLRECERAHSRVERLERSKEVNIKGHPLNESYWSDVTTDSRITNQQP